MRNLITDNNTIVGLQPLRPPATGPVPPHEDTTFGGPPPADECTRDDLLDLAVEAQRDSWPLVGSRDHVEAICADYGRLALELEDERARTLHYTNMHLAELEENNRLRELLARQTAETAQAQRLMIALDRATLALTGETCQQVMSRLAREDAVERAERQACERFERAGRYARAYYVDVPDHHVVEVPA
jgi:hypothetical protein